MIISETNETDIFRYTYAFNLALIFVSALAAFAGRGAKTPVDAKAAAEQVANDFDRNSLRESASSLIAAICVLVPTEVGCEGANPMTSVDAMRVIREVHKMEVFMIS